MKLFDIILKAAVAILLLLHLSILIFHAGFLVMKSAMPSPAAAAYGLFLLFTAIILIRDMIKNKKQEAPPVIFFILIAFLAGGLFWIGQDGPPLENDYHDNDVICRPDSGYNLLKQLSDIDSRTALAPVLKDLKASNSDPILIAGSWEKMKPYRKMVNALADLEIICDLSPQSQIDDKILFLNYTPLKTLTRIYSRCLLSGPAPDPDEPADEFIRLFGLWAKALKDSRVLLHKIMFASLVESQIETAFTAVSSGRCTGKTLERIQTMTKQFDVTAISMKSPVITEYLILKNTLLKLKPEQLLGSAVIITDKIESDPKSYPILSRWFYYFGFKPNLTLSGIKSYFDRLIEIHNHHPADFSATDRYIKTYSAHPPIKNMLGWLLNNIAGPDFSTHWKRLETVKIKNDLLTAAIAQKLGKRIDVTDLFTQKSLRFQSKAGRMTHPGADGLYNTHDDIVLEGAETDSLERYLGLYQVVDSKCEATKGIFNPCPEIGFFEIVKGPIFSGIGPGEAAFVTWKVHEDDPEASYEAWPVKQHKALVLKGDKLWLTGSKDPDHQEYLILKNGRIAGYRFFMKKTNPAGKIIKRNFNYQLVRVTRKEIKKFKLSYPDVIPFLEVDQEKYQNSGDAIHQKASMDEKLFSTFFTSKKATLKWHVVKDENGHFEDILDGQVSKEDKIPALHTADCVSTHQGKHHMYFCDATLNKGGLRMEIHGGLPAYTGTLMVEVREGGWFSCFFHAAYPIAGGDLNWKILSKKLTLTSLDFKKGQQIFGWLSVRFQESAFAKGQKTITQHQIEGFIKPIIE